MKRDKLILSLCMVGIISLVFMSFEDINDRAMPYPEGFRKWVHVKTTLTGFGRVPQTKFDGFHHIYANEKAITGYETGHFPDGAIIVFDKQVADTARNVIKSGSRKFINVMYKDSKAFADTGGWGFEEFTGDSKTEGRLSVERQQSCFKSCHQAQASTDFVFTKFGN